MGNTREPTRWIIKLFHNDVYYVDYVVVHPTALFVQHVAGAD
jgi:hypothetical protein